MGIYAISVYFLTAPTPLEVAAGVETMVGFSVGVPVSGEKDLFLLHPAHPEHPVVLSWATDRQQRHTQLQETLQMQLPLPFPTYPASIDLSAELLNTRAYSYLRNVALAVLFRLGGVAEQPFTLPSWANHPWQQVPARSGWERLKSLYIHEF
jgi:hypothetical protein